MLQRVAASFAWLMSHNNNSNCSLECDVTNSSPDHLPSLSWPFPNSFCGFVTGWSHEINPGYIETATIQKHLHASFKLVVMFLHHYSGSRVLCALRGRALDSWFATFSGSAGRQHWGHAAGANMWGAFGVLAPFRRGTNEISKYSQHCSDFLILFYFFGSYRWGNARLDYILMAPFERRARAGSVNDVISITALE